MTNEELTHYRKVQDAARYTLDEIIHFIKPGVTEADLLRACDELQRSAGVDGYWYESLPAVVLAGDHTTLAISRTPYVPQEIPLAENDLVTIDLNPSMAGYCGDCARSFYLENGLVNRVPLYNREYQAGWRAQNYLHERLLRIAHPDMTFGDLYQILHEDIEQMGFEQLDYLGHGVHKDMQQLDFIAPGVTQTLGAAGIFTLEPQIRLQHGRYGFKHENLYFFQGVELREL